MSAKDPHPRPGDGAAVAEPSAMTHVAVRTTDIESSVSFYQRYAGLHVVHDRNDRGTMERTLRSSAGRSNAVLRATRLLRRGAG